MLRMIPGLGIALGAFALLAGCGGGTPTMTNSDLASRPVDMAKDLTDLAMLADLLPPSVPVPAGCNTATAPSGTTMFTTLNSGNRCQGGGCHNQGQMPAFNNQATFMSLTINKPSSANNMNYVTPNQPNSSYVLYKLRNLQLNVPNGNGSQMPLVGTPLTDAEFCTVYDWVLHGAPAT